MEQQEFKNAPETAVQTPQPEEVPFVPYVTEARQANSRRKKIALIILALLSAAALLLGGFLFFARRYNFYSKTMKNLQFDYRNGESMDEETKTDLAARAEALAGKIGSNVRLHANVYAFSVNRELSSTVSQYDYTRTADEENLHICTGKEGWFSTASTDLKHSLNQEDSEAAFPHLYAFFFAAESSDDFTLQCVDSYYTGVGKTTYVCEVYVMDTADTNYTLYRYYCGDTLKAVRVLSTQTERMDVYDITELTF